LIMLIRRNLFEVWHIARIEKRGGDLFLEKIDTLKVRYVTTSSKIHAVKSFKQVYPKQNTQHTWVHPQDSRPWPSRKSMMGVPSPSLVVRVVKMWSDCMYIYMYIYIYIYITYKKSSRKDSWYQDYSVLLTLPSPSCHQMPSPFVTKTARNI